MEYQNLLELIKTVSESNITGFHYENGGTKIIISTVESGLAGVGVQSVGDAQAAVCAGKAQGTQTEGQPVADADCGVAGGVTAAMGVQTGAADAVSASMANKTVVPAGNIVKSPLVGTFYTAPSEEAAPFVNVGDHVKVGQTLAIVEAMKLMNDIESEFEGTVTQVFVKNGDCVEYGQPLFAIG